MKFKHLILSNAMLLANFSALWFSSLISYFLTENIISSDKQIADLGWEFNQFLELSYVVCVLVLTFLYELPIRRILKMMHRNIAVDSDLALKARQRLLNEPYVVAAIDFIAWIIAGMAMIIYLIKAGVEPRMAYLEGLDTLLNALITVISAFLILQYILQKKLAPKFFPDGRLSAVPGTYKTKIRKILLSLTFALNIIPMAIIITTFINYTYKLPGVFEQYPLLGGIRSQIVILSVAFVFIGIFLTVLISKNLSSALSEITEVLRRVGRGKFQDTVRVTTNDEIGYIGDVVNKMISGLQEREVIKDVFGKYVSRDIRDEILSGNIPLDGEKKIVTALFCDLRNFTTLTEKHDPKFIIKIMNHYFKEMDEAIQSNNGLVMQFIGDEIYAVFGAPIALPSHPSKAFRAGIEMNRRLAELNTKFEKRGWPTLRHGIGIHTGESLAAIIGSPQRGSYSLVGDNINLASRLQSLTKEFGCKMILSKDTYRELNEKDKLLAHFTELPPTIVKGRESIVEIYSVE